MKNPVSSIKEKIAQYIQLRFELLRLEVIERLVNVMGYFFFIIIAIFLSFLAIFFIFLGIAEVLSAWFDSKIWGYIATALVVLLCSAFVFMSSRRIIRFFGGLLIGPLTKPGKKRKNNKPFEEEEDDE